MAKTRPGRRPGRRQVEGIRRALSVCVGGGGGGSLIVMACWGWRVSAVGPS